MTTGRRSKTGIRNKYEALRKKYKLPGFDELDSEFEIGVIEAESGLLREIRKQISEKVSDVNSLFQTILQPDTNLVDLYESRVFDEPEKRRLFELFKRLMVVDRTLMELAIENDEKLDAAFIKSFAAEWKKTKPELLRFVRKLRDSWEKDTEDGEKAGYMG